MIDYTSPLTEEFLRTGKSVSCPIVDMHAHMFNCYECIMITDTADAQVAAMDASGVQLALFCSHDTLYGGYPYFDGDLAEAKKRPDRLRMYQVVYSPDCDPDRDLKYWEAHDEIAGLKFHCDTYQIPAYDSRHEPYYDFADARKLPVLFHTWGSSKYDGVEALERVLEKHQDMTAVIGHSFRDTSWKEAIRVAKTYPNVYLELTAVLSQQGMVDAFVEAGLGKKILFGVDAPWFSYPFGIGALLSARITDEDRRDILYRNAIGVLKRSGMVLPKRLEEAK